MKLIKSRKIRKHGKGLWVSVMILPMYVSPFLENEVKSMRSDRSSFSFVRIYLRVDMNKIRIAAWLDND